MINILKSGTAGMRGESLKIDNISNNVSNVNTYGFKKRDVNFSDLLYQGKEQRGTPVAQETTTGLMPQTGRGSQVTGNSLNLKSGSFVETNRSLDVAIEGTGFFGVEREEGSIAYTREGAFSVDEEGFLVNSRGYRLMGELNPLPPGGGLEGIEINSRGEVFVEFSQENQEGEDDRERVLLGRLELFTFENPAGLASLGGNLLEVTEASGEALPGNPEEGDLGSLRQGFLEGSNVNLLEEMSQLILSQRYFQLNSRSLRYADEMWSMANQMKR